MIGLCWRGVGGADEQQLDSGGRRGWWLVGSLAVIGAAAGAYGGYRLDPDVSGLVPALAVAGFGLGGLLGLLLLAPVGLWRAWRRRPDPPAIEEPVEEPVVEEPEVEAPEEPEELPPPEGGEPGWYPDPDGVRRYWDGQIWTGHVWRGRERERAHKARKPR